MPLDLVQVHRCFGGTHCFHLQGRRVSEVNRQHSNRSSQMFRRNALLPFSGPKRKQAARKVKLLYWLFACWLGLLFDPEDVGSSFLRNVCKRLPGTVHSRFYENTNSRNISAAIQIQNAFCYRGSVRVEVYGQAYILKSGSLTVVRSETAHAQ
jgi:hypothetical protein